MSEFYCSKRTRATQPSCPVITIAGSNGKGSTVAVLQAIYLAAGYRTGAFTSPYLYQFNEQICIQGQAVSDEELIYSFERIERCRGDISLTPFEFNTLAAFDIFHGQIWMCGF